MNKTRSIAITLSLLATGLLATTGVAQTTHDIATVGTVTFNAGDSLTNTTGITDWNSAATLSIVEGSDLSNVDFTALGIASWTTTFTGPAVTTWDGANLSGITLTFMGNNPLRDDSFVGTNLSGATINAGNNQPFVSTNFTNLNNANFSGTTFNFSNPLAGAFGFNAFGADVGSDVLAGADFTNSIWLFTGMSDGDADAFNVGPGSTSIADSDLAADFSGADFSGVTDSVTMDEIIANLGLFDGDTAIGAFFDDDTVLPTGFTSADLIAAGWQGEGVVSVAGDFNNDGDVDCDDLDSYIGNLGSDAEGALAPLDLDNNGVVELADANMHITTLVTTTNGVTGTLPGDVNCDGTVNVLGDALALVTSLGGSATMYSQGDVNLDGTVNVLGDALILVTNLGMSNTP